MLRGRDTEQAAIGRLLDDVRGGASRVLVVRGEPGIGKSSLLDAAVAAADGMIVVRGTGIESEARLPYAGLHLMLRSAMHELATLPEPQRVALETAFGLHAGTPTDPLLVGLGVLSMMSEAAEAGPVLCVVDDAQWLDSATRDALLFASRRLDAEGVGVLFAARDEAGAFPAPGLPELRLAALPAADAAALLDSHAEGLSPVLRYRVLAEARGNPLALIELPTTVTETPAGTALPLTRRLQDAFEGRLAQLPPATRVLLTVAAASDDDELGPILTAAGMLGSGAADLAPAEAADLVRQSGRSLTFRHPLVRSAAYQQASLVERLASHRALADALSAPADADRRAWHLAAATTGYDESVAEALERTAEHARDRTGYAAAATAYERSAELTADPDAATRRLALAAETATYAGELGRAGEYARRAEPNAADPATRARLVHIEGLSEFWRGDYPAAHRLLVAGAELAAPDHAARMLINALHTAWYLGGDEVSDTARRLARVPLAADAALGPIVGYLVAAIPSLFGGDGPLPSIAAAATEAHRVGASVRDMVELSGFGLAVGHDAPAHQLVAELTAGARSSGGIGLLPTLLFLRGEAELFDGRHADAVASTTDGLAIATDTGQRQWVSQLSAALAVLAAIEGDEETCRSRSDDALAAAPPGAMAPGAPWVDFALGLLDLGLGRPAAALNRLEPLATGPLRHHLCALRSIPDLIEAAVRSGEPERAAAPFAYFTGWADNSGEAWTAALVARCRALLAADTDAEAHYLAALAGYDADEHAFDQARTALLYGEWLRRARRRADARLRLTGALEIFSRLGATAWADRVRGELAAAGEAAGTPATTPAEPAGVLARLTPQEGQIVRLAATGLSNRDIAAQLFLSPRTVGHHLYKAYPKLGVLSRAELAPLLAS